MGKSNKKKNTASSSSASAAAPPNKCTCDHPYNCSCGNRPPRPSKGHKWHPEEQVWAGKGHKQKGASGQTASVAQEAKTTSAGKTQIAQWQRLPSQLLQEACKRSKRPNPKYKNVEKKQGLFRYRLILPDPKQSDKDLFFVPSQAVANEEQAKEESAILALFHLTPDLPHERKLPEPYKSTWLSVLQTHREKTNGTKQKTESKTSASATNGITDAKALRPPDVAGSSASNKAQASTNLSLATSYTSLASKRQQREERRRQQNARIRRHEAIRMANQNPTVFMSARIRKQIESLLRGEEAVNLKDLNEVNDSDDGDEPEEEDMDDDAQAYVRERLHHEGFTMRQARTAYREIVSSTKHDSNSEDEWDGIYEECLQWLLVHLDEDQLPEVFDPRGMTLDVVVPVAQAKGASPGTDTHAAAVTAAQYGLSVQEARCVADKAAKEKKPFDEAFWGLLQSIAGIEEESTCTAASEDMRQIAKEEVEALEAIFDGCTVTTSSGETFVNVALEDYNILLQVVVRDGAYPGIRPVRVLVSGKWPKQIGTSLHVELIKFVSTLPLGEPMIFEIHSHVRVLLESSANLPEASLLPCVSENRKIELASDEEHVPDRRTKAAIVPKRRVSRERRKNFWTIPPQDTPPAVSFPPLEKSIDAARKSLPAAKARSEFLAAMERAEKGGRVVLVTGETGSGKSTQLPAYLLESDPAGAKIVVAQPRRLAATGVASRVADERGEKEPGMESVGYVVRGDSAICERSRLVFCTTGVLLRQLQNEGALECITHIVIDEVHERHLDGDVLLGLLKQSLSSHRHLRVVLMSATLDAERFATYWDGNIPHVHIPGRTFPVVDYTLEDVLSLTRYIPPKRKGKKRFDRNPSSWNDEENSDDELEEEETPLLDHGIPMDELVSRIDETSIDSELVTRLLECIVQDKDIPRDGSILVFLAGAPEINNTMEYVRRRTKGLPLVLLPLHGGLEPREQRRVFDRAQKGFTKVILSTNVAETSVTIPDCTVVIDLAREKQASYDPFNRMPLLLEKFASKASLKQRRGRAGRVREGTCYKLISRKTLKGLEEHSAPEISRVALDSVLLQLLFLGVESGSGTFMRTLLDPPSKLSIDAAAFSLQKLGAVDRINQEGDLTLTPLGLHLAGIPSPPIVGKLLVMGTILGCRDAAIAMAAGMSVARSPFLRIQLHRKKPQDSDIQYDLEEKKQQQIIEQRNEVKKLVGNSDHALLAAIFSKWKHAGNRKSLCESLGLSYPAMREMSQLAEQFDSSLVAAGFASTMESNCNGHSWRIVHASVVSAMSNQLVKVRRPAQAYHETAEGAREKKGEARELKFFVRTSGKEGDSLRQIQEERVFIHPASANFAVGSYSFPYLVYNSMVRTSKPFLRDVTEGSPYALLLFGGELEIQASKGQIVVDGWAQLSANARIGSLMGGLRERVDVLLTKKVNDPSYELVSTREMKLIVKLLMTDGLGN